MIVVDASAAVAALLNDGPARHAVAGEQLHVPHLIDPEVANVLRRKVASGEVASDAGRNALDAWRRMGMIRYPVVGLLPRMWALRDNLSAYDAACVALAEELDRPLLTADARVAGAHGVRCSVTVVPR